MLDEEEFILPSPYYSNKLHFINSTMHCFSTF